MSKKSISILYFGLALLSKTKMERDYLRADVREKFDEVESEIIQDFVQRMPNR